jgi:LuxR family maltose regulon positive regulatory protein
MARAPLLNNDIGLFGDGRRGNRAGKRRKLQRLKQRQGEQVNSVKGTHKGGPTSIRRAMRLDAKSPLADTAAFSAIERPRVLHRISQAARYPITTIIAPAGYGKSTAIRQFLGLSANSVLIETPPTAVGLDEFVVAFAAACTRHYRTMGAPPIEPSSDSTAGGRRSEIYAAWALANLGETPCTIAVDDLHHTDADPTIATFLVHLAQLSKGQIKWLFSSRTMGNLPHSSWQAYAESDLPITADDLRLSVPEALALAEALGSPATPKQIAMWVERTQGFPVFLAYAIRLSATRKASAHILDGARSVTFSFLVDQLWKGLPARQKAFLELAALLPPTRPRAYEAADIEHPTVEARRLAAEIAFLRLSHDGTFSMHDMFRDFIKDQLLAISAATLNDRYILASAILFRENRFDEAFSLLVEHCPVESVLEAVETHSPMFVDQSTKSKISKVLRNIAASELGLGALSFEAEYCSWNGEFNRSQRCVEEIIARPYAGSEHVASAVRSLYRFANFQSSDEHERLIASLPSILHRLASADRLQAQAYEAALLARLPGREHEARSLIADVAKKFGQLEPRERVDAQVAIASAQFYFGDSDAALKANYEALQAAKTLRDPRELARTMNNYGLVLYHMFDARIEELFDELRPTVEKTGAWRFSHVSHWLPAEYYAWKSDVKLSRSHQKLQHIPFPSEEPQAARLTFLRRHTESLCKLIEGDLDAVTRDLRELGLPREAELAYELLTLAASAYALGLATGESSQLLQRAKVLRESLPPLQFGNVRPAVVLEIIALCAIGRWLDARRLLERIKGSAPNLAALDIALTRFCDGPPFVGAVEAVAACKDRPYMGLAALLMERVLERAPAADKAARLTPTEIEVLRLLGLGKSNKEIAAIRSRSIDTVKRQVAHVYNKLGVENRTAAVAIARERGLL